MFEAYSEYNPTPSLKTELVPAKKEHVSAFLMAIHQMSEVLNKNTMWAIEYDWIGTYDTMDYLLKVLATAPDDFSSGVMFGKISMLQTMSQANGASIDVDSQEDLDRYASHFIQCSTNLNDHGLWSLSYEDTNDFKPYQVETNEATEIMMNLENLLATAPTQFCRGVVFGKMSLLMESQACQAI